MLPRRRGVVLLVLLTAILAVSVAGAQAPAQDTTYIVKDSDAPSNVAVAVDVARATFADSGRVLISRDDTFADALSSGLLQADAPLLLVPSEGPVPPSVRAEIQRLGVAEAIVLGGDAAVSPAVVDELQELGLTTERRQGGSRFDTAIDVARTDAPEARTVMLARAFPSPGGPESQAFADTLAAGGIAARQGFPILLTQTEELTQVTADYLTSAGVERVLILGGTAAISDATAAQVTALGVAVERIAGPSRAGTATEIARIAGDDSAADAARVIVTDGFGDDAWAAGFALASHAAAFDAPIVLVAVGAGQGTGVVVPPETEAFLDPGVGDGMQQAPVLTCAVAPALCEPIRAEAQLPPAPEGYQVLDLVSGASHACAVGADGRAACWGTGGDGQLGDGSGQASLTPVLVAGDETFVEVAVGERHSCGITTDGEVRCWGANDRGQLGSGDVADGGSATPRPVELDVALLGDAVTIDAGADHTCVVTTTDVVLCWGSDADGQRGDGDGGATEIEPNVVQDLPRVSALSTGDDHTCVLDLAGAAQCWGKNLSGQVGDGSRDPAPAPRPVVAPEGVAFTTISGGGDHTCGTTAEEDVYCWGLNADGQIGDGGGEDALVPTLREDGETYRSVEAGGQHTCAITTDDTARCWGSDTAFQHGGVVDGVALSGERVVVLSSALDSSCAITVDGVALCWGPNTRGQVGSGDGGLTPEPTRVASQT